ncbi:metallophosphoesterase, partial [Bacillus paranthracis]|nr:metallophosphoesterase [Bacillus paranthracis]
MKKITRRDFLKTGMRTCLYSFITTSIGYYYAKYIEPHLLSFTEHTLKSQLIPKSFHGMKIL